MNETSFRLESITKRAVPKKDVKEFGTQCVAMTEAVTQTETQTEEVKVENEYK